MAKWEYMGANYVKGIILHDTTHVYPEQLTDNEIDALLLAYPQIAPLYRLAGTVTGGGGVSNIRYVKADNINSDTIVLAGISSSTAEERKRMRFYRDNMAIFLDADIAILQNDVIEFFTPFTGETFRAFY
jgi:hypothetical protein